MKRRMFVAAVAAGSASIAFAQSWPTKPVRLVVPYAPGGATDLHARIIASALSGQLGQTMLVDNRAGGGGTIGTDHVAKAAGDGYTFLVGGVGTHAINPTLFKKLPYDTARDFTPVALIGSQPNVLAAHPSVPASTPADLVRLVKARPGFFSYASPGQGTSNHLAMEMFKSRAGLFIVHIPYRGGAQALQDVLGGTIPLTFINLDVGLPHIKAGRLKAIAVSSPESSPLLPSVPSLARSGYPGFEATSWTAVYAPATTPAAIVSRMNTEIRKALQTTEIASKLGAGGFTPSTSMDPQAFSAWNKAEQERWAVAVKSSGATSE